MSPANSFRFFRVLGALLLSQAVAAQQNLIHEPDYSRPAGLSDLPDSFNCKLQDISILQNSGRGDNIVLKLADDFQLKGIVTSLQLFSSRNTIVVRSTNFPTYTLSLIWWKNADNQTIVIGRLISFTRKDALVLQNREGNYVWVKKDYYELVNE